MNRETTIAWIKLSLLTSIKPQTWSEIFQQLQYEKLELLDLLSFSRIDREHLFQTSTNFENAILKLQNQSVRVKEIFHQVENKELTIIPITDKRYPQQILQYLKEESPVVLYSKGNLNLLKKVTIGIIGTRNPSKSGIHSAINYSRELTKHNISVISGYAKGIDQSAHLGALQDTEGATVIIPACGINKLPLIPEIPLTSENSHNWLTLSPFPPDNPWQNHQAIDRNHLISALSDGLFAVETGLVGGSSYAIKDSFANKKPVWTLQHPQNQIPPSAEGNPSLIHSSAKPLTPVKSDENIDQVQIKTILETLKKSHKKRKHNLKWPIKELNGQTELF